MDRVFKSTHSTEIIFLPSTVKVVLCFAWHLPLVEGQRIEWKCLLIHWQCEKDFRSNAFSV